MGALYDLCDLATCLLSMVWHLLPACLFAFIQHQSSFASWNTSFHFRDSAFAVLSAQNSPSLLHIIHFLLSNFHWNVSFSRKSSWISNPRHSEFHVLHHLGIYQILVFTAIKYIVVKLIPLPPVFQLENKLSKGRNCVCLAQLRNHRAYSVWHAGVPGVCVLITRKEAKEGQPRVPTSCINAYFFPSCQRICQQVPYFGISLRAQEPTGEGE